MKPGKLQNYEEIRADGKDDNMKDAESPERIKKPSVNELSSIYVCVFSVWILIPAFIACMARYGNKTQFILLALIIFWAIAAIGVSRKWSWAWRYSFILVFIVWLLPAYQTLRRIAFVIKNGALDDERSSPLLFLLGMMFEQVFLFIPLTILLALGFLIHYRKKRAV